MPTRSHRSINQDRAERYGFPVDFLDFRSTLDQRFGNSGEHVTPLAAAERSFGVPKIGSKSETPRPRLRRVSVLRAPKRHERSPYREYKAA